MFRVDFPLPRLFQLSMGLAGLAFLLSLTAFFGGVSTGEAEAAGKRVSSSSGRHSRSMRNVSSRRTVRRHNRSYGQRSQYGRHNSRRGDGRGYGRNHRNTRRVNRHYSYGSGYSRAGRYGHNRRYQGNGYYRGNGHNRYTRYGSMYISNGNGARVISNYNPSSVRMNNYYDMRGSTMNGVSINGACPSKYNCGTRYYDDGTGPRIIELGRSRNRPPKVITYSGDAD